MVIINDRIQYAVGQGGFHAASLTASGCREMRYVVDCGASLSYSTRRNECIDQYIEAQGARSLIDVLFITHAHADHVNGVERLLDPSSGMQVDAIVMPLLSIVERLLCFARTAAVDPRSANSNFYRDFVVDPVSAIDRFEPGQIILVTPSGPDQRAPTPAQGDDQDLDPPDFNLWPDAGNGDRPWKPVGAGQREAYVPDTHGDKPSRATVAKLTTVIPDSVGFAFGSANVNLNWMLVPFVDPGVKAGTGSFLRALAKSKKLSAPKFLKWLSDRRNFKEFLTKDVKELVSAYETLGKDLNVTSLSVYSGPMRRVDQEYGDGHTDSLAGTPNWRAAVGRRSGRVGWLATGDAALKAKKRRKAFLDHYGTLLREVHTFVLPHHGSEGNFNEELLQQIEPSLCVAAADRMPNWRHPGTAVVQAVASSGAMLSVVTSSKESQLEENAFIEVFRVRARMS